MAPSVGISYKVVVWSGPKQRGKCLKDVSDTMPRADPPGPLGGPDGRSEDRKYAKTRSASEWRNNLASKRGHIKHSKLYQAPRGMNNMRKGTRRLSDYADWWEISNWRQEIGANNGIKITEKEEMIMWGTVMMGNPTNPAHAKDRIVPENHADVGLGLTTEDHIDAETVPL